ncbi:MAG: LLM class flavin-dependent oxidoreductase [Gammaproteobacteria bacterium]
MFTALYVPTFNDYASPQKMVSLAQAAERAGWDGFFIWDHVVLVPGGHVPLLDATAMLGALAQATRRMRLGAMVTPLARRRPWKFAKELTTLDRLSDGRMVCGVGLGEPAAVDFAPFGEDASPYGRARRLDEGLTVLDPLLRGETVNHEGNFYQLHDARIAPACEQRPRMPVWVAAARPAEAGFRRAARWDGCFPVKFPESGLPEDGTPIDWTQWWLSPAELAASVALVRGLRSDSEAPFDFIASGRTLYGSSDAAETLQAYRAAGATWWFEWLQEAPGTFESTLEAVRQGPPRPPRAEPAATLALREAVQTLHAEIDRAAHGDRQALAELQRLIVEVESTLKDTATPTPGGLKGLRARITELEFAHPRATAILNDISVMLSNLGI